MLGDSTKKFRNVTEPRNEPLGDRPSGSSRISARYELLTLLGRGGAGEVWRARDTLTNTDVAVKLLSDAVGLRGARAMREVSLLRRLRVPGVVALLDEGTENGQRYLVMDLIEGLPFPSRGEVWPWARLAPTVAALLQTLSHVHDTGVVHRDLKPENVLLDARGRPTLLDFGVSWEAATESLTRTGDLVGTPVYVAPEQVLNERVTPATDLYALGVMLYEALCGVRPFEADDVRAQIFSRLFSDPRPLREHREEIPAAVEALVLDLLRRDAAKRPRSAREVLRRMHDIEGREGSGGLRLDDGGALRRCLELLHAGAAVDVVGPRGSGRTHLLRSLRDALAGEGRTTVLLGPSDDPFGSVAALLPSGAVEQSESLDALRAQVVEALRDTVALADDAERLDTWSLDALERAAQSGRAMALVWRDAPSRVMGVRVDLAPLDEGSLRALFDGPELLFHVATDAARILHRRTEGLAGNVLQELESWMQAGMASLHGGRVRIGRESLERLGAWLDEESLAQAQPAAAHSLLPTAMVPESLQAALRWIAMLAHEATPAMLARVMERPGWDVSMRVDALVRQGFVHRDGERLRALVRVASALPDLDVDPATRAKLLAVLPDASPRRLALLLATSPAETTTAGVRDLGAALRRRSRLLAGEGRLGAAITLLREGVLALRGVASHAPEHAATAAHEERDLLALWLEFAAMDRAPTVMHRLAYEVSRAIDVELGEPERIARLQSLVEAARIIEGAPAETLATVSTMAPFADASLERVRLNLWARAARVRSLPEEAAHLDRILTETRGGDDAVSAAMRAGLLARLRYREGRFRDAAEHFAESAEGAHGVADRLAALLASASASMEAFDFARTESRALEALALAERLRHAVLEARARWILRASAYRRGAALEVDDALLDAVALLNIPYIDALVSLNETAVAWRHKELRRCGELTERARAAFAKMGVVHGANLCRALLLTLPTALDDAAQARELASWCEGCDIPGIGIQAAGLLASRYAHARDALAPHADALAAQVDRAGWSYRAEVISVDEALAWIRGAEA